MQQARTGSFEPRRGSGRRTAWRRRSTFPRVEPGTAPPSRCAAWESGPHVKEEEFARAIALGLFDYLRKSRSQGFVVSISGGADSAAVACLVAMAIELAVAELGAGGLSQQARLHRAGCSRRPARAELVRQLLTCVYQATRNSSTDHARGGPRRGRRRWGRSSWSSTSMRWCSSYVQHRLRRDRPRARPGRPTTSRCRTSRPACARRACGCWPTCAARCCCRPATAREAAVGYATMDGDTCGGLSPIAGIDKAFLRALAAVAGGRRARRACDRCPRWPPSTRQPPTAELRPPGAGQTDEAGPDALRAARRDRAGGDPRQADAAGGLLG